MDDESMIASMERVLSHRIIGWLVTAAILACIALSSGCVEAPSERKLASPALNCGSLPQDGSYVLLRCRG